MKNFKGIIVMVLLITLSILYAIPVIAVESADSQNEFLEVPVTSIILRTIEVYMDGQKAPLKYAAFIDTTEKSVISLNDCSLIFGAQIEVIDTRLLLRKGSQEFILEEGDYWQLPPAQIQKEEITNIHSTNSIYLCAL